MAPRLQSISVPVRASVPGVFSIFEMAGWLLAHPRISRDPVPAVNSGHNSTERRRSERLFESLPLIVRGTDLLGQPFEERTSTLSFNLHGCQYSSKHHLPRNSWVTLELPDKSGVSSLRARVAWVQRPHSIRDFFQVAVELESPANVWKRTHLPADWLKAETQFPSGGNSDATSEPRAHVPLETAAVATTLGHFMNASFRGQNKDEAGSGELAAVNPLLRDLRAEMERRSGDAPPAPEKRPEQTIGFVPRGFAAAAAGDPPAAREESAPRSAAAEAFFEKWKSEFEQAQAQARQEFSEQLTAKLRELEEGASRSRELLNNLTKQTDMLRAENDAAQEATSRVAQARLQLEAMEAARASRPAVDISKELTAANQAASADWQRRLQSEISVAEAQWNELLQSSIDASVQKLVGQLSDQSQEIVRTAEKRMTEKLDDLRGPFNLATAEARHTFSEIQSRIVQEVAIARGSLADVEQAASRTKEFSSQIEAATHDTLNELHRRLETILNSQTSEMNRRAEGVATSLTQRISPVLDTMGQQFLERTSAEMESRLAPHMERVPALVRELNSREAQAEESLRLHRERLRQVSENNQREASSLMAGTIANLQRDFESARKDALTQWTEELDATGVRAAHATAESMGRSSEWFQQEARAKLQVLVEQELANASTTFAAKTETAAQQFEAQLAAQSTGHLDQIRAQVESVAGEFSSRARTEMERAAESAAASFGTVLHNVSSTELENFTAASRTVMQQRSQEFEQTASRLLENLNSGATDSIRDFHSQMASKLESSVAEGRSTLASEFAAAMDGYRAERDAHHREWQRTLETTSEEASHKFHARLESSADTWISSSMRRLNEHGQNGIESLLRNADQALRDAFSKVFEGLAETLRERSVSATASAGGVAGFGPIGGRESSESSGPRNEAL